jgi:hypothetical protein
MSHGTIAKPNASADNGDGVEMIVRPQTTIGVAAEQARTQAEIQSALMVAAARPRDEQYALDRIKNACQRPGLAASAEYCYSRGGTEIIGPTIDLLTVIANQWGNVLYGFRELAETQQDSTVEAYAWDLETNAKRAVTFTVKHARHTKSGTYPLTDPRDRYENLANMAQRRVRACLEAIIPPDVVEDAVQQCRETLKANADVTPDSIKKLTDAFSKIGVTQEQITKRLGRRLDTMQPAQLVSLRRVYKSIQDGMSKVEDWFEQPEGATPAKTATEAATEALKGRKSKTVAEPPAEPTDAGERPQTTEEVDQEYLAGAIEKFSNCETFSDLTPVATKAKNGAPNEATRTAVVGEEDKRKEAIRASRGERSNQ